jgi:predicted amidohydrolase YtcJ
MRTALFLATLFLTTSLLAAQPADLILVNGKVTTLDPDKPAATAVATRGEFVVAVGTDAEVRALAGPQTRVIDAGGRRVIPGLNDSHLHATRAGKFWNLELRWDDVGSLARGLELIRDQAKRTPPGQWVRVIGAWSPFQFEERRLPTPAELTAASPDVPVFVLFLYSKGYLNKAGVAALGITDKTQPPPGCRIELTPDGGAVLHAEPSPMILYQTVARLPGLSAEDQVNSTRRFYRELNRLGVTSAVDAGGGGHAFPDDYGASITLAAAQKFPVRIGYYLFAQKPGTELADYERWTAEQKLQFNLATARLNGLVATGAGENLVWSAGDFENFMAPRPELDPKHKDQLTAVVRRLTRAGWPIRIHATYDESITKVLDVFEPVFAENNYAARWAIDHAETLGDANLARIKRLGGGVAVQNRMYFAGEYFVERYGPDAARNAPPLRKLLDAGVPFGAGTDATRVSSHNPWFSLYWLVTGKTAGGLQLAAAENRLSRVEALTLYTVGSAWFTGEEKAKGRLKPGQLADFAVLSADFFEVPEDKIRAITSDLTVVGGDVVYAADAFAAHAPAPLPPVAPSWSPAPNR